MPNYYSAGMLTRIRVSPMRAVQALVLLSVTFALAVGYAGDARADAAFEGSTPANGETFPGPVTEIELRFSDPIGLNETETRLLDADGTDLIYEPVELDGGNAWLLEPAISLDEGIYGVVWQAEAADGHTIRGVVRFGVGEVVLEEPAAVEDQTEGDLDSQLAAAEAEGSGGGGVLASIAAVISNVGIIIGWGVALFVAFVSLPRMTWVGEYLIRIMRLAGIVAVVGALIDLGANLLGGSGWNLTLAAALRLLAGVALAAVPGMVNGTPFIWVLSGAIIVSYALDGHTVTAGPIWVMVLADAAHVTFAAIWGGGIIALAIALALVLRKRTQEMTLVPDGSELAVRFSRLATYSVIGVAITGVLMSFFIMPSPGALVTTTWGWILLIKVALVAALAFFGYRNHFHSIPEIEYAQVQRDSGTEIRDDERQHLGDLRRTLVPEMALVIAVLVMSGLLVQASPIAG
jgi:copper transport protein